MHTSVCRSCFVAPSCVARFALNSGSHSHLTRTCMHTDHVRPRCLSRFVSRICVLGPRHRLPHAHTQARDSRASLEVVVKTSPAHGRDTTAATTQRWLAGTSPGHGRDKTEEHDLYVGWRAWRGRCGAEARAWAGACPLLQSAAQAATAGEADSIDPPGHPALYSGC